MFVCCECCVLSGRGLCDELITRPEESYRLWRVVVCDQETSRMRRLKPATGLWKIQTQWVVTPRKQTTTNKQTCLFHYGFLKTQSYGVKGRYNQRIKIRKWGYILIWSDTPQILELPFLALLWHTCWTSTLLKMKVLCSFEWSLTACFMRWRHIPAEQSPVISRHL